ncbi:MAG: GlmU family protein [Bacteroidia bacterium]|nr:GlmU family protein [Bacteroidia bacterium]
MNCILFDDERQTLLPLTFTRPVSELRIGIFTIREKWEKLLGQTCSHLTVSYLSEKYPLRSSGDNLFLNGSVIPDKKIAGAVVALRTGESLYHRDKLIASRTDIQPVTGDSSQEEWKGPKRLESASDVLFIRHPWDVFAHNDAALRMDYELATHGRKSLPLSSTNRVIAPEHVFLEAGAVMECATINASTGPVYIGKDAEVMEGCMIRGPFAMGEHSQLKMGAKIYGATTIGPECRVGGEVNNSVISGYSNKAHDGFLGNSVIGEWCNLGADSNNSNLKNNYSKIKVWCFEKEDYISTGLQFCGLIMGDHSKCSINTMFNTGTVVGVSANVFGNGFPPKFIPSFSWGGAEGFATYRLEDAMEVASRVFERRKKTFHEAEQKIFRRLFNDSTKYRAW